MKTESIIETKPINLRSVHVDGPQPGQVATVIGIVNCNKNGQWLECYIARFNNGELWHCPVMAVKDYERIQ